MADRPSFVVEDQSEVIDFLAERLAPAKRIDTHGAVVFLSGDRGYVQRIVRGYFNPVHISDGLWRITIRDLVATIELEFKRDVGDQWYVKPVEF